MVHDPRTQEGWERVLRKVVCQTLKCNKPVVVNEVRQEAEKEIEDISEGFFARHDIWKKKSRDIINDEFEKHQEANSSSVANSPEKTKASKSAVKPNKGKKRKSDDNVQKPKKKKKVSISDEDSEAEADAANDSDEPGQASRESVQDSKEVMDAPLRDSEHESAREGATAKSEIDEKPRVGDNEASGSEASRLDKEEPAIREQVARDDSSSEMSVLIDEDPKPKRRRGNGNTKSTKEPKKKASLAKEPPADADPDAEEIKLLQRRLVKCGIRKMWFKELAPYETSKAKIRHLNDMLSDAGMKGRYSDEKAAKIREERELKQDLEAVQEGNKRWGQEGEDSGQEESNSRSKRKMAKGLAEIQHLVNDGPSDDDEW